MRTEPEQSLRMLFQKNRYLSLRILPVRLGLSLDLCRAYPLAVFLEMGQGAVTVREVFVRK